MAERGPSALGILNYCRPIEKEEKGAKTEEPAAEEQKFELALNLNPLDLDLDLLQQEKQLITAEADSALHLALTNRAALNVDAIIEKMSIAMNDDSIKDPSPHFKDIIHELVDYPNFKLYLEAMTKTTPEMDTHKVIRVLKDGTVNALPLLCFCRIQYPVNKDDENVVQACTQNTMLFWPSMINGVSPNAVADEDMMRYRCSPIDVKSLKFNWMLEEISEEDRQPYAYRLLSEIMKRDQAD